jgi:hypothetical protein
MSFMKSTGKALADIIPGLGKFTFDDSPGKIFVPSGTGVVGYRVAMSLLEAGHTNVRVGIWKGDLQAGEGEDLPGKCTYHLREKGAEVIDFDWTKPEGKRQPCDFRSPCRFSTSS